ncbi:MAG: hypothetical protein RJB39_627, partial [Candidatus Parcubacteria bacterium]
MPVLYKKILVVLHAIFLLLLGFFIFNIYKKDTLIAIQPIPDKISCVSYEPSKATFSNAKKMFDLDSKHIYQDLVETKKYTNCIR